ncbi:hypothetical protein V2J09_009657 [Rumex salicifolius]
MTTFFSNMKEGNCYKISNFGLALYDAKIQHCSHKYKIIFARNTTIYPSPSLSVPIHGFIFIEFEKILASTLDESFHYDVIGLLVGIENTILTFKKPKSILSDDIVNKQRRILRNNELDKLLQKNDRYLSNYKTMPKVVQSLISDDEQKEVYGEIINAILSNSGGVFFLYGYGGTWINFIWRALSACIRSKALLIPGGRTAHSRFKIPIKITEQGTSDNDKKEAKEFSQWLLSIGDGTIGYDNDGEAHIEIPNELLMKHHDLDLVHAVVKSIYPSILDNHVDPKYFKERAVLAPTHEEVDKVNDCILSLLPGDEKVYLSSDSLCNADTRANNDESIYTADYLNTIRCFGVPNHVLKLKTGVPIMLLRNIDQSLGLCNGTRLITTQLDSHVIQGRIISGNNIDHSILIPRMSMTHSDTLYPFKFQRR